MCGWQSWAETSSWHVWLWFVMVCADRDMSWPGWLINMMDDMQFRGACRVRFLLSSVHLIAGFNTLLQLSLLYRVLWAFFCVLSNVHAPTPFSQFCQVIESKKVTLDYLLETWPYFKSRVHIFFLLWQNILRFTLALYFCKVSKPSASNPLFCLFAPSFCCIYYLLSSLLLLLFSSQLLLPFFR